MPFLSAHSLILLSLQVSKTASLTACPLALADPDTADAVD